MGDQEKKVMEQMTDCRRTGLLCLFVSAFLYAGTLIPGYSTVQWKLEVLAAASLVFLLSAVFFCWRMTKLKKRLNE